MEFYCLELVFLYTGPKTQTEICKNEDTIFWLDNAGLVAGVAAAQLQLTAQFYASQCTVFTRGWYLQPGRQMQGYWWELRADADGWMYKQHPLQSTDNYSSGGPMIVPGCTSPHSWHDTGTSHSSCSILQHCSNAPLQFSACKDLTRHCSDALWRLWQQEEEEEGGWRSG